MKPASTWRGLASLFTSAALLAPAALFGCGERCDPGYHLDRGLCYVEPLPESSAGAAGAAGADDGASPTDVSSAACDDPSASTFAKDCTSNADCVCDSDFCAGYPGSVGFCTRTGCDADPSVCPSGYGCMDLSAFGAGLPSICTH